MSQKILVNYASLDKAKLDNSPFSISGTISLEFISSGDMSRFVKPNGKINKKMLFQSMDLPTTIELK